MEENRVKVLVEHFKVIDEVVYLRLENGNIAVEDVKSVIIDTKPSDNVELVSLQKGESSVNFWQVNGKINALATKSFFVLPENAIISDFYEVKELEGVYVKYVKEGICGIVFVSETEVAEICIPENNYKDIVFADGVFYAESKDNKFDILGQDGKIMFSFPFKCKKVEGYNLFYTDRFIFSNIEEKIEIEGKFREVKVISVNRIQLIRVLTDIGIYYYDTVKCLLGPIKNDVIMKFSASNDRIHILEEIDGKILSVFYIRKDEEEYYCTGISSSLGIERVDKPSYLLVSNQKNGLKNVYSWRLDLWLHDIETYKESKNGDLLGLVNGIPVQYVGNQHGVRDFIELEFISKGLPSTFMNNNHDTYICKSNKNEICCIRDDGARVFVVAGQKCCIKKYGKENREVYFIENGENILVKDRRGRTPDWPETY